MAQKFRSKIVRRLASRRTVFASKLLPLSQPVRDAYKIDFGHNNSHSLTSSQPHSLTVHGLAASQPRSLAASQLPPSSVAAVVVGSRSSRRGSVGGSGSGGGLSAKSPVGGSYPEPKRTIV